MKREILNFSNKISRHLPRPGRKSSADMTYGILAYGSCLLTDIVDQFHEESPKVNSVERLTRHLNKGIPQKALSSYLAAARKWAPSQPVIHIGDSGVVKPDGRKFEALVLSGAALKARMQKMSMKRISCHGILCADQKQPSCQHLLPDSFFRRKEFCLCQRHHLCCHGTQLCPVRKSCLRHGQGIR